MNVLYRVISFSTSCTLRRVLTSLTLRNITSVKVVKGSENNCNVCRAETRKDNSICKISRAGCKLARSVCLSEMKSEASLKMKYR